MKIKIILGMSCLLAIAGCASLSEDPLSSVGLPGPTESLTKPKPPSRQTKGVYHKVKKGETLWRIAQAYDINVDDIIKANSIPNAALIEKNQLLFIPGVEEIKTLLIDSSSHDEFMWPINGRVVKFFNERMGKHHNRGIHIETRSGNIVKAARDGHVVFSDYLSGYAQTVIIDHGDHLYSVYAQNAKALVKLGDFVLKGEPVAHVGQRGRKSYLHFEIRKGHKANNPLFYLPRKNL